MLRRRGGAAVHPPAMQPKSSAIAEIPPIAEKVAAPIPGPRLHQTRAEPMVQPQYMSFLQQRLRPGTDRVTPANDGST